VSAKAETSRASDALRVILIDDHTLFRTGLRELLERRGLEVVAAVGDGYEGCELAETLKPDVILLDLRMPDIDGLAVLEKLKEQQPQTPVVMLTTSSEQRDLVKSLRLGARGYLHKDMEPEQLIESLREIMEGNTVVAPAMSGVLAKVIKGEDASDSEATRFSDLTPRELEILCHLAEGQTNKVIGRELGITDGTVKLHVRSILKKLGVQSRVAAAVLAVEEGVCRDR
jgi:two-component system nitrate/nitrite response regulator NarL